MGLIYQSRNEQMPSEMAWKVILIIFNCVVLYKLQDFCNDSTVNEVKIWNVKGKEVLLEYI